MATKYDDQKAPECRNDFWLIDESGIGTISIGHHNHSNSPKNIRMLPDYSRKESHFTTQFRKVKKMRLFPASLVLSAVTLPIGNQSAANVS